MFPTSLRIVSAILIGLAIGSAANAQSEGGDRNQPAAWELPWTVFTIAPDGSWGTATEVFIYQAIAGAVSNCKRMSRHEIGCGAQLKAIRSGWIVAVRCGRTNIIAAEPSVAAAESAIAEQERALRLASAEGLPACSRVVTVNQYGNVIHDVPAAGQPGLAASGN